MLGGAPMKSGGASTTGGEEGADRIGVAEAPGPVAPPASGPWPATPHYAEASRMLLRPGDPDWDVKRPPEARAGDYGPGRSGRPAPQAHLTAAPVRRKRWMALSAALIASWARELSIAAARKARRPAAPAAPVAPATTPPRR